MDTIANLLTSIRNAEMARLQTVLTPTSKLRKAVATILQKEGYIAGLEEVDGKLKITLGAKGKRHTYKRVSKLGRRVYVGVGKIPLILGGKGMVIISTSEGVLSGREARKRKLGGELICEVY
ncbi:MAG: 30S ribosomal protein S8 [bacterium]